MKRLMAVGVSIATLLLSAEILGMPALLTPQEEDPAAKAPPAETANMPAEQSSSAPSPLPEASPLPAMSALNEWAALILARPLFSSNRRPNPVPVAQASRPANLPRLSGLVSGPGGNFAIFQPDQAAHPVVVGEGATLGQWTVRNIAADTVTISRDEEHVILHTTFADASAAPKSTSNALIAAAPRKNHFWAGHVGGDIDVAAQLKPTTPE